MFTLFDYIPTTRRLFKSFQDVRSDLKQEEFDTVLAVVIKIAIDMDNLAEFMRKNIAFEENKGEYERMYKDYLSEVKVAQNVSDAEKIGLKYKTNMESVKINKPERPMRIGIIGEIYVVVEPFSNCHLEKWLANHGVEIIRTSDLSRMAVAIFTVDEQVQKSGGYVDYNIGSTANDAIAQAYTMINDGIDGIIHVKPASCSPEITAMTILQNMSRDFDVPIIYLTFDTETSEAGLHTRLEAFHDMIMMKGLT
jgi:predicted nucleotide-binding protein (sugar kinase/HSP70/actin superfamily)